MMFEELILLYSMCMVAVERMERQIGDFKYMAKIIGLCETSDGAYDYEMELLRLEGLMEECRGIAAFTRMRIMNGPMIKN